MRLLWSARRARLTIPMISPAAHTKTTAAMMSVCLPSHAEVASGATPFVCSVVAVAAAEAAGERAGTFAGAAEDTGAGMGALAGFGG